MVASAAAAPACAASPGDAGGEDDALRASLAERLRCGATGDSPAGSGAIGRAMAAALGPTLCMLEVELPRDRARVRRGCGGSSGCSLVAMMGRPLVAVR